MELEQMFWTGGQALSRSTNPAVASSLDVWSSNIVEGLKAWSASPADVAAFGDAEYVEALSVIDGAFQAVRSALTMYS